MLQPSSAFDPLTQLTMAIREQLALDPATGTYLTKSHGRRRSGRRPGYCITVPTFNMAITTNGIVYHENLYLHLTAESDVQAIERANTRLANCKPGGRPCKKNTDKP